MGGSGDCKSERDREKVSEILRALTNHHCRETVRYLRSTDDGVATRKEIATHLESVDDGYDFEYVVNLLYHKHLPKLADAGIIDNDTRSGTVRYLGDETAERVLDEVARES